MSRLPLTKGQVLYANSSDRVTIYQGLLSHSLLVVIKEQSFDNLQQANCAIQEAMAMSALSHPGILKVYDCAIEQGEVSGYRSVLVVEWMERDLGDEIRRRKEQGRVWTDAELIQALRCLVSALSYAQKQGISHRDIKPCNIMLTGSTLKLGDFGSASRNLDLSKIRETIQGSPFFLSPELKREYARMLQSGIQPVHYDPVRSDVYSLGVTMLEMASLEQPTGLVNLQNLKEETYRLLVSLEQYPHLQPYLAWMMEEDVEKRPTFIEIEDYMQSFAQYYEQSLGVSCPAVSQPQGMRHSGVYEEAKAVPGFVPYPPNTFEMARVPAAAPQHYQSASAPLPSVPRSQCIMCTREVGKKPFDLPDDLISAAEYASSVCSLKCLKKMSKMVECQEDKCCNCDSKKKKKALELPCGHWFHSQDCLFVYMAEFSRGFQGITAYQCPCCPFYISYPKTIAPYFGGVEKLHEREAQFNGKKPAYKPQPVQGAVGKKTHWRKTGN